MPWNFPAALFSHDSGSLRLSAQDRVVVVLLRTRADMAGDHCWLSVFVCHCPYACHLALRLLAGQVAKAAFDKVRRRPHGQLHEEEPRRDRGAGGGDEQHCGLAREQLGLSLVQGNLVVCFASTKSLRAAQTAPMRQLGIRLHSQFLVSTQRARSLGGWHCTRAIPSILLRWRVRGGVVMGTVAAGPGTPRAIRTDRASALEVEEEVKHLIFRTGGMPWKVLLAACKDVLHLKEHDERTVKRLAAAALRGAQDPL